MKNEIQPQRFVESQFKESSDYTIQEHKRESTKPLTKDMLVLGELNRGTTKFEKIVKNTGIDSKELDSILKDLENRNLMRVEQKNGVLGPKVELFPTDKGFKEYYS